jgi:hypothetical protein
VTDFLADAERIFETALSGDGEVSILIGDDGALRMIMGSDWPLDSLQSHHGARAAYQVRRSAGQVRVEGKSATARCLLQSEPAAAVAKRFLFDRNRYYLAPGSTRIV